MTAIRREHILDLPSYERSRAEIRPAVLEAKRRRRVHLGGALTFDVRGQVPETVGCDLPGLAGETVLDAEQREALRADLAPQ